MTGCDSVWAVCGVVGAVGRAVCVAFVRRCACSDAWAVHSCCGRVERRAGVRDLRVCMLRVSARYAVLGLLVCAVLGDKRHDADVPLC